MLRIDIYLVLVCIVLAGKLSAQSFISVTNTQDSGPGSLRSAIFAANNSTDSPAIIFSIPAESIIQLQSRLPELTKSDMIIDGSSAPGFTYPNNMITLNWSGAEDCMRLQNDNIIIKGLTFTNSGNGNGDAAIRVMSGNNTIVEYCSAYNQNKSFVATNGGNGTVVTHCTIEDFTNEGSAHVFRCNGGGFELISNCDISDIPGKVIELNYSTAEVTTFRNNTLTNVGYKDNGSAGGYDAHIVDVNQVDTRMVVRDNKIEGCKSKFVEIYRGSGIVIRQDSIFNNTVLNCTGQHVIFIDGESSSNPYIGFNYFDGDGGIYNQDQVIELHYAKYGRIRNNVIKNAKARGIMFRDSDVTLIRDNIMYNLSGNHAIELNDDCDEVVIRGNILGTDSLNTPGLSLFTNDVIAFNDCDDCIIGGKRNTNQGNQIIQSNSGRVVSPSSSCEGTTLIQGNDLNVSSDGQTCLTDSDKYVIEVTGSTLHFGGDFELYHNRLAGKGNYGLFVKTPNSLIEGNLIGCTELGLPVEGNNIQFAIMAWEGDMTIGSKTSPELRNKIGYNTVAVYNSGETNVCWSGNEYNNNTGNANGEVLVGGIEPPEITGGTMPSTVSGTARPNARVEVYLWNPATAVQGYQYLGHAVADGAGSWSFTGDEPFENQIAALQIDGLDASGFASWDGFDIFPPTANHDHSENNTVGSIATINILENDTLYNGSPAAPGNSTVDIDPETAGNQSELVIEGEGVWNYNAGAGILEFEPESGFTSDPSHILYKLTETSTGFFDLAVVVVDYLEIPPLASDDESLDNQAGDPVILNIITNDQMSDGSAVNPDLVQVDINSAVIGIQMVKTIPDKGVWTYDEETGNLTFQPFTGTYTTEPIEYRLIEAATGLDDRAMVTVTYLIYPPEAADDVSENNYYGAAASMDILSNDILLDGSVATPDFVTIDLDPSLSGNQSVLFVEEEGTWNYNSITGHLIFMPEFGFFDDPTPVVYTLTEIGTGLSDDATVTVIYVQGANINPPENLAAGVFNTHSVLLTWEPPSYTGGAIINWDDGTNYEGIGLTSGGTFSVAARWTPEYLQNYDGYSITSVKIFIRGTTIQDIHLKVWSGENASLLLLEQQVEDLSLNQWHNMVLDEPISINPDEILWIGYTVADQAIGSYPAGCDNGPAHKGFGDKFTVDGINWENLKDYGFDFNWNIQAVLEEVKGKNSKTGQLSQIPVIYQNTSTNLAVSGQPNHKPYAPKNLPFITGYHIFKEGDYLESVSSNENSYVDTDLPDGTYSYEVSAAFDQGISFPSDPVEVEIPGGAGPEIVVSPLAIDEVHPNPPEITAQQVTIENNGTAALQFSLAIDPPGKSQAINSYVQTPTQQRLAKNIENESGYWNVKVFDEPSHAPSGKADPVIRWDNGENHGAIGIDDPTDTFEAAAYFPDSIMVNHAGMVLTQMQVYFWDTPFFLKIKVYGEGTSSEPGALIYEQQVGSGIPYNSWTTFTLGEGIPITGEDLWIGYEVGQSSASEYPAGFDEGPAVVGFGDMNKLNGVWASMSSYGFDFNWNIAGLLSDQSGNTAWLSAMPINATINPSESINVELNFNSENLPLGVFDAILKVNSNDASNSLIEIPVSLNVGNVSILPPTNLTATVSENDVTLDWNAPDRIYNRELLGYEVFRDGESINETTETTYLDENLISGNYSYFIIALYDFGESDPSNIAEATILPSSLDPTIVLDSDIIYETHDNPPAFTTIPFDVTNTGEINLEFNLDVIIESKRFRTSILKPDNTKKKDYDNLKQLQHPPKHKTLMVSDGQKPVTPWKTDSGRADEIIRYDDGAFASGIGVVSDATLYAASYFPADSMSQYAGMYLDMVEMYIDDLPIESKVIIYGPGTPTSPGDIIFEQEFVPVQSSWNLIDLTYPLLLDGDDLWIAYTAVHSGGQTPCGTDVGPAVTGFGDWYSVDGFPWSSLSASGIDRNWNLAGHLTGEPIVEWLDATPVSGMLGQNETTTIELSFDSQYLEEGVHEAQLIFTSNDPSNPEVIIPVMLDAGGVGIFPPQDLQAEVVEYDVILHWTPPINAPGNSGMKTLLGYNIYRGGTILNTSPIADTTFTDPDLEDGYYEYDVTAVFENGESDGAGPLTVLVGCPYPVPQNLVAEYPGGSEVYLFWEIPAVKEPGSIAEVLGYNIYRDDEKINDEPVEDEEYTDENAPGGYHEYYVTAVYEDCESGPSNPASVIVGIAENSQSETMLFPNPATDFVKVVSSDMINRISITSIAGRVVYDRLFNDLELMIDCTKLPRGIYFVEIITGTKKETKKLLIK
ncbi:MAG: right-handed parallel beta-helix repeat-containing protein [Bacteroidales bacterium]|nr:right-handed parallel beta-helix repeat-containing protein [Bacteroidales bacterium]